MCERLQVSMNMAKRVIVLLLVFSLPENYCARNSSVPVTVPANTTVSNATVSSTTVSSTTVASTTPASQFLKTTTINPNIYDRSLTPTEEWDDADITLEDPPKNYETDKVFTSKFYAFKLGGSSAVIVIAVIIATCLVFCGRKRNASQKQSGCENPAFEEDNTTTKTPGQLDNFLPIYDYAYTHTRVYNVSPAVIVPSRSAQQLPRQQRSSACSDNTESHYYTEIDDYFKKQAHRENKARHNQDPPLNNSSHLNSPPPEYDYAYGKRP